MIEAGPATEALPRRDSPFRPEIQGLRAVAMLAVLVYHVWPAALPGGYVGVDVFFVISGYLISGLLLKEAEATGRVAIARFYARRIKRLLPAASLVLVVVAVFLPLLPSVRWQDTASEIAASALYVQNWWLAGQAIDYLAAQNAAGPLQHFWSLSVEEQYYILWPLLFPIMIRLPGIAARSRRALFGWFVATIGLLSLAWSVYQTASNPGFAYFATTTRAWELALGGALAVAGARLRTTGAGLRACLGWIGIACIFAAGFGFSAATPFPGYAALLPTIGAALIIAAGASARRWSAARLLSVRPMQYLGDISYSLYLWHWPVVIFCGVFAGRKPGFFEGTAICLASVLLAHFSKRWVEDPCRARSFATRTRWQPFVFAAACILVTLLAAELSLFAARRWQNHIAHFLGVSGQIRPALADARNDIPAIYANGCHVGIDSVEPKPCSWGSASAGTLIVLVGDSHAAQWVPAFEEIVARHPDWKLTSFTKSGCPFAEVMVSYNKGQRYVACAEWNRQVRRKIIDLAPDFVVTTQTATQFAFGAANVPQSAAMLADGLRANWKYLLDADIPIIAIRDTPSMDIDVPDCLASPNGSLAACGRTRQKALGRADPILLAAAGLAKVELIDMSDDICLADLCPPVIGGVLVWRDALHLTATYARALSPALERRLLAAMARSRKATAQP